jgi:hypothetical protein
VAPSVYIQPLLRSAGRLRLAPPLPSPLCSPPPRACHQIRCDPAVARSRPASSCVDSTFIKMPKLGLIWNCIGSAIHAADDAEGARALPRR